MTSDSQEKSTPQPVEGGQKALPAAAKIESKPETPRPSFNTVLAALGLMLLEILLPVIISAGILWFLFDNFNLWQAMDHNLGLILFGVAVVVVALLLAGVIDSLAAPFRKMVRARHARFTSTAPARVIKLALGGVIIPLLVVGAANFAPLRLGGANGTLMQIALAVSAQPVQLAPPEEVGAIARSADNPSTKILSIQVLQGFHSPEGLDQLVKLATGDSGALSNPAVADALSKAIAAYGTEAKLPLFNAFRAIDPAASRGAAIGSGDLYIRYFAPSFDSLKTEITASTADASSKDARLAQLQAAQAQLKDGLAKMQGSGAATTGVSAGDSRLDFILQSFLAMDLKQDGDLLAFARTTAMDTRYASVVRGDALLLMGKLGGKDDLNALYPYLKSGDDLLQARALQAIAALQVKLGTSSK